ncbi:restriction endonuclease subunit S, partial [[Mycoplasma] collis]|uniref:restriction endonuclease subunit S n=1 Tax=[Mycoplasma] collis TaxID=2127 RepID=UPI00051C9F9C
IDIIDPLEKIKNNLTKILEKQNLFNIKIMNLINFHSLNKAKFKLKDLVNIETGKNITIKNLNENYGKYPVYSSKTQNNGIFGFLKTFDFEGKYILISSHGKYAGTVKYVDEKFSVTNNCFVLKNKNDILTKEKYLFNVLLLKDLNKISKGSAQGFLSKEILKEIDIFLPPLKLQNFILEIPKQIKKIKFLIENTEQKLLKLII